MLPVAELCAGNFERAVGFRDEVENHRRRAREEVQVRIRRRAAGDSLRVQRQRFRLCFLHRAAAPASRSACLLPLLLGEFIEVRVAHFPRVQQQAGAREHVARQQLRVAAVEDVAILVADLASGGEKIRVPRRHALRRAEARKAAEPLENAASRLEARRCDVDTGERRDVREFDGEELIRIRLHQFAVGFSTRSSPLARDADDLQRCFRLRLQIAGGSEIPAVARFTAAHLDGDVAFLVANTQRVVARSKVFDQEEAVVHLHLGTVVGGESARVNFQKRNLLAKSNAQHFRPILRRQRHAHHLPRACMNRRRPSALKAVQLPTRIAAIRGFGVEALYPSERAERHAALLVRLQRDGLRACEAVMLKREDDLLVRDGLAVLAEQLVNVVAAKLREMPVVRRIRLVHAVHAPRMRRRHVALLAAVAEHLHLPFERRSQRRQTLGHGDFLREDGACAELEVFEFLRRLDAVVRRRSDRELRILEHLRREVRLAEHQRHAHAQRGRAAGEQLLALDVKLRIQHMRLRVMLELRERRKRPRRVAHDERALARLRRKRHDDARAEFFIRHELATLQPHHGVVHLLAFFIQHREHIAARRNRLHHLPLPHTHQRPAAAPAADKLHDPRAAPAL